ncbi:MAG: hypothetical protein R2742_13735 [Micropruina glycogenica]
MKALASSATSDDAETIRTAAEQALARANAALDDEGDLAAVRTGGGLTVPLADARPDHNAAAGGHAACSPESSGTV